MAYVGAFAVHGDDPELCLITTWILAGERVKILRWSTGVVRTAKGTVIALVPIQEGIERLRCLLVSETPRGQDQLEGADDLVAAAYAYTSAFEDELSESSALVFSAPGKLAAPGKPAAPSQSPHKSPSTQNPRVLRHSTFQKPSRARKHVTEQTPNAEIYARKKDFIQEGVIAQMVTSNLVSHALVQSEPAGFGSFAGRFRNGVRLT